MENLSHNPRTSRTKKPPGVHRNPGTRIRMTVANAARRAALPCNIAFGVVLISFFGCGNVHLTGPAAEDARQDPDAIEAFETIDLFPEEDLAQTDIVPETWARRFGGEGTERNSDVGQLSDGSFLVVGSTGNPPPGGDWLLLLDQHGDALWQIKLGDDSSNLSLAVSGQDPEWVMAGQAAHVWGSHHNAVLMKVNAAADLLWIRYFSADVSIGSHAVCLLDSGYILTAGTAFYGEEDVLAQYLDQNAELIWSKTYGGSLEDKASCVIAHSSSTIFLLGNTMSFGQGDYDTWILALDDNGEILWQKTYGTPDRDLATDMEESHGGGMIVLGKRCLLGGLGCDIWVMELDVDGSIQWQKYYDATHSDDAASIALTSDGGYVVGGAANRAPYLHSDGCIVKMDGQGTVQWFKRYRNESYSDVSNVLETQDLGFIAAGTTRGVDINVEDFMVLKFDANGSIEGTCMPPLQLFDYTLEVSEANVTVTSTSVTAQPLAVEVHDSPVPSQTHTAIEPENYCFIQ
jgi:hypothetical protein